MNRKLSKEIFIISKGLRLCLGDRRRMGCLPRANERNRLVMALADASEKIKEKCGRQACAALYSTEYFYSPYSSLVEKFILQRKLQSFSFVSFRRKFFSKMGGEREKERLLRVFFIKWREQLLYLWQRRQWMENFWKAFKELSGEGIPKIIFSAREIKNKKCKLENVGCVAYLYSWRRVLTEALYRLLSLFPTLLLTLYGTQTRLFTSKEIGSPAHCTISRTFNSNSGTTLQLLFLQFLCSVALSLCFSDLFTATQCLFSCSAAHISSELIFNLTCFSTNIFVNIILGALCNCACLLAAAAAVDANSYNERIFVFSLLLLRAF